MNIVVDTNVLISGILWFGPPHDALSIIMDRKALVQSSATIEEFSTVIHRPRFSSILAARGISPDVLVETLIKQADFHEISHRSRLLAARIQIADTQDRPFLELAIESDAEWLITGDKHILAVDSLERTRIGRVADFLRASKG